MQTEKTIAKCKEIERLVSKGSSLKEAYKETNLSPSLFATYKKTKSEKEKPVKEKKHRFIDIVTPARTSKVAVVICSPEEISSVIAGLL